MKANNGLVLILNPCMYEAYKKLNLLHVEDGIEYYGGVKVIKADYNGFKIS
ncbi:MAG: hypothetical protein K0S61_679 [Anaerocolumna sp.]|jgi:hypothetical protein|nr:hypothetical protein [Anaerocolumna sp.]